MGRKKQGNVRGACERRIGLTGCVGPFGKWRLRFLKGRIGRTLITGDGAKREGRMGDAAQVGYPTELTNRSGEGPSRRNLHHQALAALESLPG